MTFCWCQSVDVNCECHSVDVTLSKLKGWFHFIDNTVKNSLCLCPFVDVSLLISLCWCQTVDVILFTIRYVNEQHWSFYFEGITDTSSDMTLTTFTLLSELSTWSLKTCRTLSAGSANNRAVWILPYKTNIKVGTQAQMGLNHSVYVASWLKTTLNVPGWQKNMNSSIWWKLFISSLERVLNHL